MARCKYCKKFLLFDGIKVDKVKYCDESCVAEEQLSIRAERLPPEAYVKALADTHSGRCPRCRGLGPVDVHTSYRAWSAIYLTSWSSRPEVSCNSCGFRRKIGDTFFTLFLGWWGFPWGLIAVPLQVGRNLAGTFNAPNPTRPSPELERIVKMRIAESIAIKEAEVIQKQLEIPVLGKDIPVLR